MATRNRDISKRMNWFDRQFLRAQDFMDEQDYHLDRRRRHNRSLHTPGVVEGLAVGGAIGANTVTVLPGTALDSLGREIVLTGPATLTLPTGPQQVELYILYSDSETDPSSDPGVTGNTRIAETPTFTFRRILVGPAEGIPPNGILLALANLTNGQLSNVPPNPDNSVRLHAAAIVDNDITVRSVTLKRNGVSSAQWPKLSCSAANEAALTNGSLRLDSGRELSFVDNGQIRSFDNFHRLVFNRSSNRMELHEFGDILFLTGNTPTEKMRILSTGSVGIGTVSPRAKLEVSGGAIMPSVGNTSASGIQFPPDPGGGAGDEAFIRYFATAGETTKLLIGINNDPTDSIGLLQAGAERLTIINENVGIGTVLPRAKLEVSGGAIMPSVGNTSASGIQFPPDPGGGAGDEAFIRYFATAGETTKLLIGINNEPNDSIGLLQAGAERLTISNGNAGIGTTTPLYKLHVVNSGGFGAENANGTSLAGNVPIIAQSNSTAFGIINGNGRQAFALNIDGDQGTSATRGVPTFYDKFDGNWRPGLALKLGNVGIGTVNPLQRLHVVGNVRIDGNLSATGKGGYIMDKFINNLGETLEEGDVVVLGDNQATGRYGVNDRIPIPEVDLAQGVNDTRVCGIVCQVSDEEGDETDTTMSTEDDDGGAQETGRKKLNRSAKVSKRGSKAKAEVPRSRKTAQPEPQTKDISKVAPGQFGFMVTLGAFAHCKVDADIAPIKVGDLLTTSPTKGHAQKVKDPAQAIGAIVGKALGALKKGKGTIPVIVTLQ